MRLHCTLLAALACVSLAPGAQAVSPPGILDGFARAGGIIETSRNLCLLLELFLADDRRRQARGLMHVEQLDEFEGMLFLYGRPARISMWMKNTYIPLDMLFLRADGNIVHIAQQTTPLSLESIGAPEPVTMVLELGGGFTDRWGIRPGNRLLLIDEPFAAGRM